MAKINSLAVRKARGSMGGMTYSVVNGQQIVKEKAVEVSNPRTSAQMNQRVKLGNVINLYRLNKKWMEKYAFPNRPRKQSVYNTFMSLNLPISEVSLTKDEYRNGVLILEPLDMTSGSLGRQLVEWDGNTPGFISSLRSTSFEHDTTIGDFSKYLLKYNAGIKNGDQLSFIVMSTDAHGMNAKVLAYEITLSEDSTVLLETTNFGIVTTIDAVEGEFLTLAIDQLPNGFVVENGVIGACFVISRKTANGVEVSTSRLELDNYSLVNQYNTAEARRSARRSYGSGNSVPFLVPSETEGIEAVTILEVNGVAPSSSVTLAQQKTSPMTIRLSKDFSEVIDDRKLFIEAAYYDEVEGAEQSILISKDVTVGTTGISYNGSLMTIAASFWTGEGMWPTPSEPVGEINPFSIHIEFNSGEYSAEAKYKNLTE